MANTAWPDAVLLDDTLRINSATYAGRTYSLDLKLVDAENLTFRFEPSTLTDITNTTSPLQPVDGHFDGSNFHLYRVRFDGLQYEARLDLVIPGLSYFRVNLDHTRLLDQADENPLPQATTANDQSVTRNSEISIAGSGADSNGSIVAYRWRQLSGPPVDIREASNPVLTFESMDAQEPIRLQFELQVMDDEGAADTDVVNVLVETLDETVSLTDCTPFSGPETASFKVMFIKLGESPNFDLVVNDTIKNQLQRIVPFNEFFAQMAFYRLDLESAEAFNCQASGGSLSGSGFVCDNGLIDEAIQQACAIDDVSGLIKVVMTESNYGGTGGEVIYIGDRQSRPPNPKAAIHEIGHNLGLADLYGGGFRSDGAPVVGWPSSLSRQWLNLDAPGCPKWCASTKPLSEYTFSTSAACPAFAEKSDCLAFNRDQKGYCTDADGDNEYDCCTWSEVPTDEYFQTSCAPAWGVENIGRECAVGTGCYFGGAYGNNSWRPVPHREDSIMYDLNAPGFDPISEAAVRDVLRCCYSAESSSPYCAVFRSDFSQFLTDSHPFKKRLGSCLEAPQTLIP